MVTETPTIEFLVNDANTLNLTFLSMGNGFQESEDTSVFSVEEDVELGFKVSSKLGFGERKVFIKAGEYKTSKNAEGKVVASVNYQVL